MSKKLIGAMLAAGGMMVAGGSASAQSTTPAEAAAPTADQIAAILELRAQLRSSPRSRTSASRTDAFSRRVQDLVAARNEGRSPTRAN